MIIRWVAPNYLPAASYLQRTISSHERRATISQPSFWRGKFCQLNYARIINLPKTKKPETFLSRASFFAFIFSYQRLDIGEKPRFPVSLAPEKEHTIPTAVFSVFQFLIFLNDDIEDDSFLFLIGKSLLRRQIYKLY